MKPYSIEPLLEEEGVPKPKWKRRFAWTAGCLVLLLLLGAWWISSESFLRGMVLDKIEKTLNAEITYESAEWSPSHEVILRGVSIRANGQKPCLQAKQLQVAYHWRDLWAGKSELNEIALVEPVLTVTMDAQGNTNLDPLFKRKKSGGKSKPIWIEKITLQKGTVNFLRQLPGGGEESVAVTHLDIRGEDIGTDRDGTFTLAAGVQYALRRANSATVDVFNGALTLSTKQELNLKWWPRALSAQAKLKIKESTGQFAFANGLEVDLVGQYTGLELRQFKIQLKQNEKPAGIFSLEGIGDFSAGEFAMEAKNIDRSLLNFVGGRWGLDFHGTVLNSTNTLRLEKFGKQITIRGTTTAAPFHLSRRQDPWPALDTAQLQYSIEANLSDKHAELKQFTLKAAHQSKPILDGKISRPMTFSWGKTIIAAPDSEFQLTVMNTNLADWRPWLGQYAKSGAVTGSVKIDVRQAGREISFGSSGKIAGLQIPVGEKVISAGDFQFTTSGQLTDFKKLVFNDLDASAGDASKNYFKFKGDATVDLSRRTLSGQGSLEGELPILLQWFPKKRINLTAGRTKWIGSFSAAPKTRSFTGTIDLENTTGTVRNKKLENFTSHAAVKLRLEEGHRLRIDSFQASAELDGQQLAASLDVTGDCNMRTGEAILKRLRVEKLDLAVLQKSVPIRGLKSGQLNGDLELLHQPGKITSAKGKLTLDGIQFPPLPAGSSLRAKELDLDLVWREGGQFKTTIRKLDLQLAGADQKQWAHWTGSGEGDPFIGTFKLDLGPSEMSQALLQSLLAKQLGAAKIISGKISNPDQLSIARHIKGNWEVLGPLQVENLQVKDSTGKFPAEALDAKLSLNFGVHSDAPGWFFTSAATTAQIKLANRPAGEMSVSAVYASKPGNGEFDVVLKDVDFRMINLLPEAWRRGAHMRAGKLAKLHALGKINHRVVTGKLDLDLRGADIVEPGGLLPKGPLDATHKLEGTVSLGGDQRIFKADVNTGTVTLEGKIIGQYDATATWGGADVIVNVKSLMLGPAFTERAVAKWLSGQRLRAGTLTVKKSELHLAEKGAGHFNGEMAFKGFALAAQDPKGSATHLDASFVIDAIATTNRVFHIRQFTANLPATKKAANQAMLSGTLDLSQPRAPTGKVFLKSDALDITPLMALLAGGGKTKPTASTKSPKRFAFRKFQVDLDVKQIHWRDLNATAVRGALQLDGPVIKLDPVEMLLQDAPAMVDGWIEPKGNQTKFNLQLSCEHLPLTPIARHFNPTLGANVNWGELTLHTHVKADTLSGEVFRRTLSIHGIEGEAENLVIRSAVFGRKKKGNDSKVLDVFSIIGVPLMPVDEITGGILFELLRLDLPELKNTFISDIKLELHLKDEMVHHELSARGPLIGYDTEGTFRLAPDWRNSPLNQQLTLHLIGRLSKKLNPTGGLFVDEDELSPMVESIPLKGTLAHPKLDPSMLDKIRLGTMRFLGKPAEAIESILGLSGEILRWFGLFPDNDED